MLAETVTTKLLTAVCVMTELPLTSALHKIDLKFQNHSCNYHHAKSLMDKGSNETLRNLF